jgi:hypothetical protein
MKLTPAIAKQPERSASPSSHTASTPFPPFTRHRQRQERGGKVPGGFRVAERESGQALGVCWVAQVQNWRIRLDTSKGDHVVCGATSTIVHRWRCSVSRSLVGRRCELHLHVRNLGGRQSARRPHQPESILHPEAHQGMPVARPKSIIEIRLSLTLTPSCREDHGCYPRELPGGLVQIMMGPLAG